MRKLIEARIADVTQKIKENSISLKKTVEKHLAYEGLDSSVIMQLQHFSKNAETLNKFHSQLCEQLERLDYQEQKGEYGEEAADSETYYPEN